MPPKGSAFHKPRGLVGDMGGGSIELIDLNGHDIRAQDTIPIGPLRILDLSKNAPEKMRKLIDKALGDLAWLGKTRQPRFYAVGGSFRALAHIHMQRSGYPLGLVHHFSIGAEEAKKLARSVQIMKPEIIAKLPGVPGKRANAMIPAAIVLQRIIEITKVNEVVFSTSGIREGFLYEKLSPGVRAEDPLIASATDLALDPARGVLAYAAELYNWMQPLFAREDEGKKRLRMAACILSEIARKMHTEYRADWAFHHILQSSLTGVTHGERVTVALCAFHRYQAKMKKDPAALSLIAQNDKNWARMVGLAMNLAYHLSGGMAGNLTHARIKPLRCAVQLQLSPKVKGLMSDTVKKRLEGLGEAFKAASRRVR